MGFFDHIRSSVRSAGQKRVAADRRFLESMVKLQKDDSYLATLAPERRDYLNFAVLAFKWWLAGEHEHDIEADPEGPKTMAPRNRIIDLWSRTQSAELQPRIDAAIRVQETRMAQR